MDDVIRIETPAAFGRRLVAGLLDGTILYAGATLLNGIIASAAGVRLWGSTVSIVLDVAYFWLLTGLLARTPGKIALGIELRHPSGRIGLWIAFLREVVGKLAAAAPLFLGLFWIAFDRDKRGWHDIIAGTRAVRVERVTWQLQWGDRIKALLAAGATVTASMLEEVPDRWRPAILHEFARRYPEVTLAEPGVLRPVSTTEVF